MTLTWERTILGMVRQEISDGQSRGGVAATSKGQHVGRHRASSRMSRRAIPLTARRLRPARAALFMLGDPGAAAVFVVIGVVVVLLFHYTAADKPPLASAAARQLAPAYRTDSLIERVAAKVLPSVVTLQISVGQRSLSGSGIVLTSDGLIMTNNHVWAGIGAGPDEPARAVVTFNDGRTAAANVVAADQESDIAVLRAHDVSGLTPISVGSSANLRVGQPVAALGSPLGLRGTVTAGIISAVNRLVCPVTGPDNRTAFYAVQTDAAINPGNSGGALVDMNGELIGMNAAESVVVSADDSQNTEHGSIGLGFAIPVDHAARIAGELVATGRASHGWLGAQVGDNTDPDGVKVIGVDSGSPAEAAGLTAGALVTTIDGQPIKSSETLLAAVRSTEPGARVTLVFTDTPGNSRTVQLNLGSDRGRP